MIGENRHLDSTGGVRLIATAKEIVRTPLPAGAIPRSLLGLSRPFVLSAHGNESNQA